MQKKLSITEARRVHAKRRALERYGIRLTTEDLDYICRMIKDYRFKLGRGRITKTRMPYIVKFKGVDLNAVYSWRQDEVVTFLR